MSEELLQSTGGGQEQTSDTSNGEGPQVDTATLEEARREGWRPLEEFDGDQSRWVDAETFVRRGREINPILRKSNEKLQAKIAQLEAEGKSTQESLRKLQEYHDSLEQRAYDRAMKDLKAQKRAAMTEGDLGRVADIEEELETLNEAKPKPIYQEPVKPATPAVDPILNAWMQEQSGWFNDSNPEMVDYANAVGIRLRRQDPGNTLTGRDFLDKIFETVKKQFPDKFERRSPVSMVEGGTPSGTARRGTRSIADLPPEARAAFKELAADPQYIKWAKDQKLTPEQLYIKDYLGE